MQKQLYTQHDAITDIKGKSYFPEPRIRVMIYYKSFYKANSNDFHIFRCSIVPSRANIKDGIEIIYWTDSSTHMCDTQR